MYLFIYSRTWQVKALATQVCVLFVWCPSGSSQLPCLMSWFNLFVFTMLLLGLFDFRRGRHISQLFSVPFVGFPQPCGLQYRTSSHCHCPLSDGGPYYWPEWSHCIIYTNPSLSFARLLTVYLYVPSTKSKTLGETVGLAVWRSLLSSGAV